MTRKGGFGWYQSIGLYLLYICADFKKFLNDPRPLNSKKRFCAAKQLYVGRH
jgi:hypothetical protein